MRLGHETRRGAEAAGFDDVCFHWPPGDRDSRFWHDEGVVLAAVEAVREVWPSR